MSQILLIAFFIAAHLVPVDVQEFTVNIENKNITFVKQASDSWKMKKDHNDLIGLFLIKGTSVTVGPKDKQQTIDMANVLSVSTNTNWKTVSEIKMGEQALQIQREKTKVVMSIPSGKDSKQVLHITWKEKK